METSFGMETCSLHKAPVGKQSMCMPLRKRAGAGGVYTTEKFRWGCNQILHHNGTLPKAGKARRTHTRHIGSLLWMAACLITPDPRLREDATDENDGLRPGGV